ncbi:hypothetical protein A2585_02095 [Candidatus Nomurabacteria bacterium RIFOXYD1_FULL_39_12]|nr:MAG: hypothetical protein A2585_02095 [Candidatus Nomurabacteria bacterium RIFOXYD1_FULL_39_12]
MKTITTLVAALALTLTANAQTATTNNAATAAATATTPTCEVVKILKGGVLEVGKEPIPFTLKTKGCEEIREISADGLEFTEIQYKNNRVSAQVKATNKPLSGTASFKLVDKDSNETESPDTVYIFVLNAADAHIKAVADKAAAAAAATSKKIVALATKVEKVSTTRPTRDEVAMAIAPLKKEIMARPTNSEVVAFVSPYEARIATLESKVNALAQATIALAEGEVALGNTRRGIFRRKLNPQVAEMAKQIRDAFAPAPAPVVATAR